VKFIRIREMMRDYTRSLMQAAHDVGAPVMRAMFYEFPEDKVCWEIQDAYMFGPDILVAPIVERQAVSRQVYLPAGADWTDAYTGQRIKGGCRIKTDAPLEKIPVFYRDGKNLDLF